MVSNILKEIKMQSRTMTSQGNNGFDLEIKQYYMTLNGLEFYVTELPDENGIGEALVVGDFQEIESFSLKVIKASIILFAEKENLMGIMPPDGWYWKK